VTVTSSGKTYTFTAGATSTVADLLNGINSDTTVGAKAALIAGQIVISDPAARGDIAVGGTETVLGTWSNPTEAIANSTSIYLSDSSSAGASTISVTIGALSQSKLNYGASNVDLSSDDLLTQAHATAALTKINQAIQNVAGKRGDLGAAINRLQSAVIVINNQSQNLSAAEDTIRAADIAQEVANMTKYSILNQTGISSLAQANTMQQQVLALLR
jgi:flagellin